MAVPDDTDRIVAACNTGPLLSAFQCAGVGLLRRYIVRIYITATQAVEFERHGAGDEIRALITDDYVQITSELNESERKQAEILTGRIADDAASGNPDPTAHLLEAEMLVIAMRRELDCRLVLLDEKAARAVAEAEGLRVTGFPGILARAGRDGLLCKDELRHLLKRCQQQGTHYSNALIEHVAETYGR